MNPWIIWMINHHMSFIVKILVVLLYPVQLLNYAGEAWEDVAYTLKAIDRINE